MPAPCACFDGVVSARKPHGLIFAEGDAMLCRNDLYLLNKRTKSIVVGAIRLKVELQLYGVRVHPTVQPNA